MLVIVASMIFLVGCNFSFPTTTTNLTFPITTGTTTSTSGALTGTTSTEIDIEQLKSEIYNRIYAELYDDILAEVLANLSQAQFDLIYDQVISEIMAEIEAGTITLNPISVIEKIFEVVTGPASAVVGITAFDGSGNQISIGSGILYKHIGDLYYVVTNYHVIENAATYQVRFAGGESVSLILRGQDTLVDLAVLYFSSESNYPTATFGDSDALQAGSIVLAVGNPNGYDFENSVTMGIVSGLNRYFDIDGDDVKDMFVNYIQHDAAINAGNSGGPLFNLNGEVVGINTIKIASVAIEGMGFAIPSNLVAAICADIEEFGVSKQKPVLGIQFIDLASSPDYFTYYEIIVPAGLTAGFYINAIVPGSTMDGHVEPGDFIVRIGEIVITDTIDFVTRFASRYRVGDIVSIEVYRGGVLMQIDNIELKPKVE